MPTSQFGHCSPSSVMFNLSVEKASFRYIELSCFPAFCWFQQHLTAYNVLVREFERSWLAMGLPVAGN